MSDAKARTIQQRFGFMDDDLKSASHDEIMLWLDENIDKKINALFGSDQWTANDISCRSSAYYKGEWPTNSFVFEKIQNELSSIKKPKIEIKNKVWEYPVSTGRDNKYIVGFIDMVILYEIPKIEFRLESEEIRIFSAEKNAFFEVKSYIQSLGELIRQVRMYQEYVKGKWCVVSLDDKFKNQLSSQGIYHLKFS